MKISKKFYLKLSLKSHLFFLLLNFLRLPVKRNYFNIKNYLKLIPHIPSIKRKFKKRNKKIIQNSKIYPKIGAVLNLNSHIADKWITTLTKHLVDSIIREFKCIIIENQKDYNKYKNNLDVMIVLMPGYGCSFIKFKKDKPKLKYVVVADPFIDSESQQKYLLENDFSYILAVYYYPLLFNYKLFSKKKVIHFPWAIPDNFIYKDQIKVPVHNYLMIFGQARAIEYETRTWCKKFEFVKSFPHSGENKILRDLEYFKWLRQFEAIVVATSLNHKYRHTVAKYFEVPASGLLLFAQEAEDLPLLGFKDNENCIIFNKKDFKQKAKDFFKNKEKFLEIMKRGRDLILERHRLSKRIDFLKDHINKNLNSPN